MTARIFDHALFTYRGEDFGARLRRLIAIRRRVEAATQEQLAARAGLAQTAISRWTRGLSVPNTCQAIRLAAVLKVNIEYLLCGTGLP